jgi:hypothetical protein
VGAVTAVTSQTKGRLEDCPFVKDKNPVFETLTVADRRSLADAVPLSKEDLKA